MVLLLYKAKTTRGLVVDSSHLTVISSGRSELEEARVYVTSRHLCGM